MSFLSSTDFTYAIKCTVEKSDNTGIVLYHIVGSTTQITHQMC